MKKVAPDVVRICRWIIRQREKTQRLDARGQKVPEYGLMPPGVTRRLGPICISAFQRRPVLCGLEGMRPTALPILAIRPRRRF